MLMLINISLIVLTIALQLIFIFPEVTQNESLSWRQVCSKLLLLTNALIMGAFQSPCADLLTSQQIETHQRTLKQTIGTHLRWCVYKWWINRRQKLNVQMTCSLFPHELWRRIIIVCLFHFVFNECTSECSFKENNGLIAAL